MLNYTVDFLTGLSAELILKEDIQPLSQYNYRLDRSTGSPCSPVSESSSPSTDSVSDMILALDKKATIITTGSKSDKPSHSYIALISVAILSSKDHKMVLGDIYEHIMKTYPYYNNQTKAWRNSIRHNLSINECFIKNGRSDNGKGNFWTIHPACVEDFSKGDLRRRHARRRARKGTKDINRNYQPLNHGNPMYTPMTTPPIGYQPMSSSPGGYQHILSPQMYQPMTSTNIGNFPFLPAIIGYDSIPSASQSYLPYQRPVFSRQPKTDETRDDNNTPSTTSYPTAVQRSSMDRFPFTLVNVLNGNTDIYSTLGLVP